MRKNLITLLATIISALGAATLLSPSRVEARMTEFKCDGAPEGSGGAPLGCYKGTGGCWMAGWGPHPDTGEFGCWVGVTSNTECCRTTLEQ